MNHNRVLITPQAPAFNDATVSLDVDQLLANLETGNSGVTAAAVAILTLMPISVRCDTRSISYQVDLERSESRARAIYCAVAGAQLFARVRSDISLFDSMIDNYRAAGLLPA